MIPRSTFPVLCLHIGITGHRPPRLDADCFPAVQRAIGDFLEFTMEAVRAETGEALRIRVVGQLAEGADRLATRAALEAGMEIQCVLPFAREEFESDFSTEESKAQFRELMGCATAVFELDGTRDAEGAAYLNAAKVMLEQCDVLIAVWDGQEARGRGGTAEVVHLAAGEGIPVYVISPEAPSRITRFVEATEWRSDLKRDLGRLLRLPEKEERHLRRFQSEPLRLLNWGWLFESFRNFYARARLSGGSLRFTEPVAATRDQWDKDWKQHCRLSENLEADIKKAFLEIYARTDHLANYYAGAFRSAYLMRYLLGGLVACLVVVGFYSPWPWQGFLAQLVVLTILLGLVHADRRNEWHLRSLEYRILAENLRMLRFTWPLGSGFGHQVRAAGRLREAPLWVIHVLRRAVRAAGLAKVAISQEFLAHHRDYLVGVEISQQIAYHESAAGWQRKVAGRLQFISMVFFAAGVFALGTRAGFYTFRLKDASASLGSGHWKAATYAALWSKVLSIVLPAAGVLFAGIRSHGEFARLSARSGAMAAYLKSVQERLETFPPARWEDAVAVTGQLATQMTGEVADWRTLIGGKGLTTPV